jgi:hypothetical protein
MLLRALKRLFLTCSGVWIVLAAISHCCVVVVCCAVVAMSVARGNVSGKSWRIVSSRLPLHAQALLNVVKILHHNTSKDHSSRAITMEFSAQGQVKVITRKGSSTMQLGPKGEVTLVFKAWDGEIVIPTKPGSSKKVTSDSDDDDDDGVEVIEQDISKLTVAEQMMEQQKVHNAGMATGIVGTAAKQPKKPPPTVKFEAGTTKPAIKVPAKQTVPTGKAANPKKKASNATCSTQTRQEAQGDQQHDEKQTVEQHQKEARSKQSE